KFSVPVKTSRGIHKLKCLEVPESPFANTLPTLLSLPKRTMGEELVADRDIDLIQGTLNVLILKTLSWGPMNGYAIAQWVRQMTQGEIELEEGALYPALHRMEHRDWITAEWGLSDNNRR